MSKQFLAAVAIVGLIAAQSAAQSAHQQRGGSSQRAAAGGGYAGAEAHAGAPGSATAVDHAITAHLLLGNLEELQLNQFALDRAQNDQVKEFAQMMLRDHQQAVQQIRQLAPELAGVGENLGAGGAATGASTSGAAGHTMPGGAAGGTNTTTTVAGHTTGDVTPGGSNAGGSPTSGFAGGAMPGEPTAGPDGALMGQLLAWHQAVAQQCVALQQRELSQKQGAEFDRCFMGGQIAAHLGMLAKLQASEQFASPQLRQLCTQMSQTVQQHLDHAKQIAKSLEEEAGSGAQPAAAAARRSATPRR